ncbi:hypothetical protein SNE40_007462 [Patella caerulea]|uniref:Protein preY, mitochondrial n=1 Tax=Patella caerulea TaxID=87958 RepID=A0AAN8JXZ3_PATCE
MLCTRTLLGERGAVLNLARGIILSPPVYHDEPDSTLKNFDENLLKVLTCPLSKKPLRYDKETNQLLSDEIGVAYSIIDGIPNLNPQDARMLKTNSNINVKIKPTEL